MKSLFATMLLGWAVLSYAADATLKLDQLQLPPGYSMSVFADTVPNARSMARGDKGTVFVGSQQEGKVYALVPNVAGDKADKVLVLAQGLLLPNGIAFRQGDLYVVENHRILRFPKIEQALDNPPKPEVIRDDLPTEKHHGWRYAAFGPDDKLYVAIGAPCNICKSEDPRFATIVRMNPDGSDFEIFASGVRNSVGFTWDPDTKEMWFTDNGRDWLGDNIPPDKLNHAPQAGLNFGYPYYHAKNLPDPEFGKEQNTEGITFPAQELGSHVAPLGLVFRDNKTLIIAEHGSWNRSKRSGYRLTKVELNDNMPISYEPFVTGWLEQDDEFWGRPVDLLQLPDGSLLISDDFAGVVYRLAHKGQE